MRKNYAKIKICALLLPLFTMIGLQYSCTRKVSIEQPKPIEIANINIFLDNSLSMAGYFGKDADFKTIVSDLATKIDKNIKPVNIWFSSDEDVKYSKDAQSFCSDIAKIQIANKDGYQLHEIIKRIADKTDSNDVAILISDCILSFPSDAIRKNREINKLEAPNALKNNIYSTFSDLKKAGMATNIYAFKSKFYGTYFNYRNEQIKLSGDIRPFYIVVIAHTEILYKFDSLITSILSFKPDKLLFFGLNEEPITKFNIIPQIERKGKWMKTKNGIKDIEIKQNEPIQFCTILNLKTIPKYAKEISYLQQNIIIENIGCKAEIQVIEKEKLDKSRLKSEPQIKLFEDATHAILVHVSEMSLSNASIHILLPLHYDTWYLDWSCLDDSKGTIDKTFALQYFIAGINEAFETNNKNYIDFTINLNK